MISVLERISAKNIKAKESDFIKTLFGDRYSKFLNQEENVIIYGGGLAGKEIEECLELHGVSTLYFCDKNEKLIGTKINGKEVISPKRLINDFRNIFVIVGVQKYKQEVLNFLHENGIFNVGSIFDNEQFYYYLQFPRWKIEIEKLKEDEALINEAYNLMSDDKSKNIFINRLSILSSYADYKSYKQYCTFSDHPKDLPNDEKIFSSNFENEMYFKNDLINLEENCCLIDCGAYDGDSFIEFDKALLSKNFRYGKSYCFEPDLRNYKKLKFNLDQYKNLTLYNLGVYDKKTRLEFANSDFMHVTEAFIVENTETKVIKVKKGNDFCDVNTIDNLIFPNKIDVIKMDVEGSEAQALNGAINTIKKYHPQLIISCYHKSSDIYNLTLLIKKLSPKYKIYLRQFSFSWSETVIIALI